MSIWLMSMLALQNVAFWRALISYSELFTSRIILLLMLMQSLQGCEMCACSKNWDFSIFEFISFQNYEYLNFDFLGHTHLHQRSGEVKLSLQAVLFTGFCVFHLLKTAWSCITIRLGTCKYWPLVHFNSDRVKACINL